MTDKESFVAGKITVHFYSQKLSQRVFSIAAKKLCFVLFGAKNVSHIVF